MAALDFSSLESYFAFGLRLVIAAVGAAIGWFIAEPIFRVLHRLAFQRPAAPTTLKLAKCAGAVAVALLLFFYYPFGMGGGGGGSGGGTGTGKGKGQNGTGDTRKTGAGTDKSIGATSRKSRPGEELDIEMIVSARYQDDKRWYLLESKEPPRNLDEVETYFMDHLKRLREINIIIYSNSPEPEHYAVKALESLAEQYKLRSYKPKEYWKKAK
jgi:hypothetical protein